MSFRSWLANTLNVFANRDPTYGYSVYGVNSNSSRPDRVSLLPSNERSIINSIITRISIDCAAIKIEHVRLDENGRYLEKLPSGLNECLCVEANDDQDGRAFIQDCVMTMLDEGCVAIVPTRYKISKNGSLLIKEMRCGKIVQWLPDRVIVKLYNEDTGKKEYVPVKKARCAIVENPLYAVMNAPNSSFKRLTRTWNLLDRANTENTSGKLDLIVKVPYSFNSPVRREQAKQRRKEIETQLAGSKYGIAYMDQAENVVQLNRSLENNLQQQIEYQTGQLYGQLGITENVMKGDADDKENLNYYNRTIEPILAALCNEMKRKFLSRTARTQRQSIIFMNDPFKLITVNSIAEIADKFSRNAIMSANEIRSVVGLKPVDDPKADELVNNNIAQAADQQNPNAEGADYGEYEEPYEEIQNGPEERV